MKTARRLTLHDGEGPKTRPGARPRSLRANLPRSGNVIGLDDSPEIRAAVYSTVLSQAEAMRRSARTHLGAFAYYYLPELHFATPGRVHRDLYEDARKLLSSEPIDGKVYRSAAYALPRGHGKSTTLVIDLTLQVATCWRSMPHFKGRAPYIVIASDTKEQAENRLADIRDQLATNPRIVRDFGRMDPQRGEKPRRRWDSSVLELPDGTIIRAISKTTGIRGLLRGGRRPSLILVDDLENDQNVVTPYQRRKLRSWFTRSLIPLGKSGDLLTIVVGTILHDDALLSRLLRDDDFAGWLKRRYAARTNAEGVPDPRGDVILWPEYWTAKDLDARLEEIGSVAFAHEYLNVPMAESSFFRREWLDRAIRAGKGRRFVYSPPARVPMATLLSTWDRVEIANAVDSTSAYQCVVTAWDLAIVDDEKAAAERDTDYTVGITVGLTLDDRIEVVRIYRRRGMTPGQLRERIAAEQRITGADVIIVENNAAQRLIELDLVEAGLPVRGHTTTRRKHSVYEGVPSMSLAFELGRITLCHDSPAETDRVQTLIEELSDLGAAAHDDTVMALWMALSRIRRFMVQRDTIRRRRLGDPPPGTIAHLFPLRDDEDREAAA